MDPGVLQIDRIRAGLRTRRIGRQIEYLPSTTSTNDVAWERIESGDADGLVVLTEHQSAGRGRLGRTWHSPRGASLLCSVALVDDGGEWTDGELVLVPAVAACDAITPCTDVIPSIKWPNDLLVEDRKVGGILIESRILPGSSRAYVIGIGINCLQQRGHMGPQLARTATSLELESAQAVDRTSLAIALLTELDRWLATPHARGDGRLREAWLAVNSATAPSKIFAPR